MNKKGYIVAINSSLDGLLELLDDYGFDYECEELFVSPLPGCLVINVWYYPHEIKELEDIFAPYV